MNARAPSSGASAITSNVGKVGFAEAFLNLAVMRDSLPVVAARFVVTVELAVLIVISGLCLNAGSYYGEILRAGLLSVPKGLNEAARSTGLSWMQVNWYVVLPPALRNVLPDLLSNTLELVKLTSLASVVSLPELLFQARKAQSVTYNDTPIVAAAGR